MTFEPTGIEGAWLVRTEPQADERGWFARTYCSREFVQRGLTLPMAQASLSFNHEQATLRGIHWQRKPHGEVKLVRCLQGAIWDVLVDVRPNSRTHGCWEGFELSERNGSGLYIPEGVGHGFVTLEPSSLVHYQISADHYPAASAGLRWNDPTFGIKWPMQPRILSDRDRRWPDWHPIQPSAISTPKGDIHASCR